MAPPVNTSGHTYALTLNPSEDGAAPPVTAVLEDEKIYAHITHQNGGNLRSRNYQEFMDKHEEAVKKEWGRIAAIVLDETGGDLVAIWPKDGRVEYRVGEDGIKRSFRLDTCEMDALRKLYQEEKWDTALWTESRPCERGCSTGRAAFQRATPFLAELRADPTHGRGATVDQKILALTGPANTYLEDQIGVLQNSYELSQDKDEKERFRKDIQRHHKVQQKLNNFDWLALRQALYLTDFSISNNVDAQRAVNTQQARLGDINHIDTKNAILQEFNDTKQWLLDIKKSQSYNFLGSTTLTSAEEDYARDLVLLSLSNPTSEDNRSRYDLALETMSATKSTRDSIEDLLFPLIVAHCAIESDTRQSVEAGAAATAKKAAVIERILEHPLIEAEEREIFRGCFEAM